MKHRPKFVADDGKDFLFSWSENLKLFISPFLQNAFPLLLLKKARAKSAPITQKNPKKAIYHVSIRIKLPQSFAFPWRIDRAKSSQSSPQQLS